MEVKKGYLVTMDDGSTEFIDWSEVSPLESETAIDKKIMRTLITAKTKNEYRTPNFLRALKYFTYALLLLGEIVSLVYVLNQENALEGISLFIILNFVLAFVCWLFYVCVLIDEI
ncbi:MAG: hypothetical protein ACQEXX_01685 [Bacillota bacterium]